MNTFSGFCNFQESIGGIVNGKRMNCYAFIKQFNDICYLEKLSRVQFGTLMTSQKRIFRLGKLIDN